jgi:hypothetical protein
MLRNLLKQGANFLGYKTNRKIIVICSDDWGGIRVKDLKRRNELQALGLNMANRFDEFDSLESNQDVEQLFDVLTKYRDKNGSHPVITAVMNVANPDFEKIRDSEFREYSFEPFNKTLERHPNRDHVYQLYKEGIKANIFKPQFHGREHLQVNAWLNALQRGDNRTIGAFESEFFFLNRSDVSVKMSGEFADAYDFWKKSDLEFHKTTIESGINLFNQLFGYSPVYFTAPVLKFSNELLNSLYQNGIQIIDVPSLRSEPIGKGRYRTKIHFMGQRLNNLQCVTRNAVFETNLHGNGIASCMKNIEGAFRFKKPAIISNHRASFVGGLQESNRTEGLRQLDILIHSILKKWPEVEFLDMEDLSRLMAA